MALYVDIEKKLGSFHLRAKFEVDGETLALLGASGCGKSMTLKCIAGIERPDRGQIILDGETLFDSEKHIDLPPQKRRVGYLFQQYALFPSMTAEQNILCCIRSGTRAEKRRALAEAVRMFRLEGLEKSSPRSSLAVSSSASRWRASSAPDRRLFCWTSRSPRSTASSNGIWSWSFPTF